MAIPADLVGKKFGRLSVIRRFGKKRASITWECRCDCGSVVTSVLTSSLRSGNTKSCGCLQREATARSNYRHGAAVRGRLSRTYIVWRGIISRCKNNPEYAGRGITVCDRWKTYSNFLIDMGERPAGLTIERTDNNAGYSKENCIWANRTQQSRNRRSLRLLTYQGKTMPVSQWAENVGLPYHVLTQRVRKLGWDTERALTTPVSTSNAEHSKQDRAKLVKI